MYHKYVCPVCGNTNFRITVPATQTLEINGNGGIVHRSNNNPAFVPDEVQTFQCTKCGWEGAEKAATIHPLPPDEKKEGTAKYLAARYPNLILPAPVHLTREKSLVELFDVNNTTCSILLMKPFTDKQEEVKFFIWQVEEETKDNQVIQRLKQYDREGYRPTGISVNKMPVPAIDRAKLCSIYDIVRYVERSLTEGFYIPSFYLSGFYSGNDGSSTWNFDKTSNGKLCVWCGSPWNPTRDVYRISEEKHGNYARKVSSARDTLLGSKNIPGPSVIPLSREEMREIRDIVLQKQFF